MATYVAPVKPVAGIARTPLPYGLFSVLSFREDGDVWVNGVLWETGSCAPVDGISQWYCGDAAVNEVQSITIGGAGLESFTLTFQGQTDRKSVV